MSFIRAYLRASTKEQDATRARQDLIRFVEERGLKIASFHVENESGATLHRPELQKLIADAYEGDVILLEQVDRLSRLNSDDWNKLRADLKAKRLRIVALDLPTSWTMAGGDADAFTSRMFEAINDMLLDMLAAIARKDYEDRRRRAAQGIERAKLAGLYRGSVEDVELLHRVEEALRSGLSWTKTIKTVGCSRATVAKVAQRVRTADATAN